MPVMLMSEDYDRWLGPAASAAELKALLKPYDASLMEAYAVSRVVNSVSWFAENDPAPWDFAGC